MEFSQQNKKICCKSTSEDFNLSKIFLTCYSILANGEKGEFCNKVREIIIQQNPQWKPDESTVRGYCNFKKLPKKNKAYLEVLMCQTLINFLTNKYSIINESISQLGVELEKKYNHGN